MKLHIVCGRIYIRQREYNKAEAVLLKTTDMIANDQYRQESLFELGNLYDKQARYEEAFSAYSDANNINPAEFDREKSALFFNDLKNIYTQKTLESLALSGNKSTQPVFIVGMPRSGTSLVEQILASHTQFYGAGELETIDDILYLLEPDNSNTAYPNWVQHLTAQDLSSQAQNYLDQIKQLSDNATYISNKMPHNFLHLGFIQMMFPRARIIHCTRNPKDTALSIFFHQFNINHPYANNLSDLNYYYQQYLDLMSHWRDELQLEIHTIAYEDLINNTEYECRQLIKFFDLDWEDNCLNFHNNKRMVNTPSYHQVRQPLYNNALNRHQHYEKYLGNFN